MQIIRYALSSLFLFTPFVVFAQEGGTPSFQVILFALIGFFGAISIIVFVTGLIVYLTRLGTERREKGIEIMEWGVSVMVVVILCAGMLRWLQS